MNALVGRGRFRWRADAEWPRGVYMGGLWQRIEETTEVMGNVLL